MNTDIYNKILKYQQKLELEPNNSIYQYKLKYYYQMVGGNIKSIIKNDKGEITEVITGYPPSFGVEDKIYRPGTCIKDVHNNVYKLSFYKHPILGIDYYKMESMSKEIKDDYGPINSLRQIIVECVKPDKLYNQLLIYNGRLDYWTLSYIKDENGKINKVEIVESKFTDKNKKTLSIGDQYKLKGGLGFEVTDFSLENNKIIVIIKWSDEYTERKQYFDFYFPADFVKKTEKEIRDDKLARIAAARQENRNRNDKLKRIAAVRKKRY
jgi:hypothetical protein